VLQKTSLVLWQKSGQSQAGSNFVAWAVQIARFEVLNCRRIRDRDGFSHDVLELLDVEHAVEAERLDAHRRALDQEFDPKARGARGLVKGFREEECHCKYMLAKLHGLLENILRNLRIRHNLRAFGQLRG
jgi:RNA polymerase sigma-70 factor (ECF subfamily)